MKEFQCRSHVNEVLRNYLQKRCLMNNVCIKAFIYTLSKYTWTHL